MARFLPGQSGNPSGRPKSARGLRELLIAQYGPDAGVLVQRLEALSTNRNPKVAFAATQLLLAYHAGKPEHAVNVAVTPETDAWTPVQMAMLTNDELEMMLAIHQRLGLQVEEHAALLPPGRPEEPVP